MKHYDDLIQRLRTATKLPMLQTLMNEAADEIEALVTDRKCAVNELRIYCGQYKQRHLGACDGCRWRADNG